MPPIGVAQENPAAGALYLTSTVVPGGACQGAPISTNYAMGEAKPTAGKAYSGFSLGGLSCGFSFKYTATQASVLEDEITIFLQVGCDVAGQAIELDYTFIVGSTTVATLRPAVSYQCTSSSAVFTYTQVFDGKSTKVKVGDVITLTLNLFAAVTVPGTPAQNWHIKTGHATTPSRVFGVGLPGGASAAIPGAIPEVFNLTAPAETPTAVPNSTLAVPVTVQNGGTTEANFTVNATDVPDGFNVSFDPSAGTVAAGGSTNVTANVVVPADATAGNYSFNVAVTGANGGNATVAVAFVIAFAPAAGNETANETGEALDDHDQEEDSGGIPGPSAVFGIVAVVAGIVVLRRRRL